MDDRTDLEKARVGSPAPEMRAAKSSGGLFYGWVVVGAAFAITFVGFGCAYTFSAFFDSLEGAFGASRGSVSLVFSVAGFLYFGLGIVSGPLADRLGARRLAFVGMMLVGLGLILAGRAQSLTEVYLAYDLGIGLGIGLAYVPVLGAVQRWFVRRRAFASGLAVSGIGVGTLVMPPLSTALIAGLGWRDAYMLLGVLAIVSGAASSLLIVNGPREMHLAPDGDAVAQEGAIEIASGMSVGEAIRTRQFAGLYLSCLCCAFGVFVPFVHLVPYAIGHGLGPTAAAMLLAAIGVGSTAGRFFLGGLADRVGRHAFLVAMYAGMAASLIIWALSADLAGLSAFALLFGLFYGGWVAILPAVTADQFGSRNVGSIIGILYTSVAFGTLAGPSIAGFIFDMQHNYTLPIFLSAGASLMAALVSGLAAAAPLPSVAEERA